MHQSSVIRTSGQRGKWENGEGGGSVDDDGGGDDGGETLVITFFSFRLPRHSRAPKIREGKVSRAAKDIPLSTHKDPPLLEWRGWRPRAAEMECKYGGGRSKKKTMFSKPVFLFHLETNAPLPHSEMSPDLTE